MTGALASPDESCGSHGSVSQSCPYGPAVGGRFGSPGGIEPLSIEQPARQAIATAQQVIIPIHLSLPEIMSCLLSRMSSLLSYYLASRPIDLSSVPIRRDDSRSKRGISASLQTKPEISRCQRHTIVMYTHLGRVMSRRPTTTTRQNRQSVGSMHEAPLSLTLLVRPLSACVLRRSDITYMKTA